MRRPRRAPAALAGLALLLATAAGPAVAQEQDGPDLQTRVYSIHFKDPKDVVILLQPLLGDYGAITLQPRLRAVTVIDEPERIAKFDEIIKAFDVAPRNVNLALQLIMGTQADDEEGLRRRRPRPALPGIDSTLIETLEHTRYDQYQLLASASFTAAEGEESTLHLGEEYRIHLELASVNLEEGVTRFQRFSLERGRLAAGGNLEYLPIWDMELNLRDNQLHVFGATRLENSKRAIFLAITAGIVR